MTFGIDKQTKLDLNIFPQTKGDISVFDYFNQTATKGGRYELANMMESPLNDLHKTNNRISAIKFICDNKFNYDFNKEEIDFIEHYLNQNTPILRNNPIDSLWIWIRNKYKPTNEYYIISRGLDYLRSQLQRFSEIMNTINRPDIPDFFQELITEVEKASANTAFRDFLNPKLKKISFWQLSKYDNLIRKKEKERIRTFLKLTYQLDAYISVATTAINKDLTFPELAESTKPFIRIKGMFHPFLRDPVLNDISLVNNNLCFVSGANMSGKSTFLKSVGLCIYLSHIGFPVPAISMETSVFNGLYSTINISDNIEKGYSHYYSEVKRVKEIALMIKEKKRVFVIFDELFRGTNVKDAYEATLLIISGFTKIKDSLFIISTHIIEVGKELEKLQGPIFKCFNSRLEGEKPIYNYELIEGISSDRLGLTILRNEKILELIEEISKPN
jgi:DNA mismatch repair ATPase MutS